MYYLFRFGYKENEKEYQYLGAYNRESDIIKAQQKMKNYGLLSWYLKSGDDNVYNFGREIYGFSELSRKNMRNIALSTEMKNILEELE